MKTSIESNKKMKRTALIIVMILLMQAFAPLLNVYAVDIETSLGTVSLISGAKKITAGEEVELVITVTGNNIFAFNGYIDYDREVFETITNANVTELPAGWNVISDGTLDTDGVGFYIEMQNSTSAGVNNPTIKMKLRAKKTTEKTKITINYINITDTLNNDTSDKMPSISYEFPEVIPTYTIKYHANTTETVSNMPSNDGTKTKGEDYTIEAEPLRTGYTFKGWNTQANGSGTTYEAGSTYTTDADLELYAKWEIIKTTLTVNPNGGVWNGSSANQTFTEGYGTTKNMNDPTTAPNGNIVKFNGNGGTPDTLQTTQTMRFKEWKLTGGGTFTGTTYTFNDKAGTLTAQYEGNEITLPNATKTGATLNGWYTASTGGTKVGEAGDNYTPTSATTLFAQWNEVQYSLTVNPNGGNWNGTTSNSIVKGTYNETTAITNPTAPNGYTITLDNDGDTKNVIQTMNFDKWVATGSGNISGITYTFGNGDGQLTATYVANSVELETPSKNGYTFDGWYTLKNGGTKVSSPYTPTNDVTLYSHWTANKYNITFNPGEGTISSGESTKEVTYGETYGTLPTPTRDGFEFEGWYDDNGNKVESTTIVDVTKDTTLIAKWKGIQYTLTINPNGGEWNGSKDVQNIQGEYKETKEISNPVGPNGYTVTFDSNDGTGITKQVIQTTTFKKWKTTGIGSMTGTQYTFGTNDETITAEYAGEEVELATATRKGYTLEGWYTQSTGGTKIEKPYIPTNDETLYAHWTENKYIITFNPGKGTVKEEEQTKEITYGETYGTLPTPTRNGYEFEGWYDNKGNKIESTTVVDIETNTTLIAKWLGAELTINFDADGGTVTPTSKTVRNEGTYGELPIPNKEGHTFIGWYDDNGNKIESTTIVNITENQTLHAKYEKNKYTVTFKNDDGSELYSTIIRYQDKALYSGEEPKSTKSTPGYEAKFKGWDNESALESITKDTIVTATYELSIIQYKIIYNNVKDSDNSKNPSTYTIKDKNITLTDLQNQPKLIFKGWFDKAVGGNKITSIDTSKLENIILYAQWENDNLYLKSEKYKIGENDIDNYEQGDIYLDKIEPNTTLKQFIENCDTNGVIKVIDKDGKELKEDDLVGTGMTIKDTRYDEEITLVAVVMGDLDGNGIVTATDFSILNKVLLRLETLEGPYFMAGDLDDNKNLTVTDFSTINNTILVNITLKYTKPNK